MFRDIPSSALMQIESRPVLIRLHGRLRTTDFIIIILIFITHTQTKKNPVERERERERESRRAATFESNREIDRRLAEKEP